MVRVISENYVCCSVINQTQDQVTSNILSLHFNNYLASWFCFPKRHNCSVGDFLG